VADTATLARDAAYRTLAASLPDMLVVVFDAELRVRMLEGGGLRHAELDPGAYEGRPIGEIVDAAGRELIEAHYRAGLGGVAVEFGYASPQNGREYRVTVNRLADGGDEPLGLAVWHDVTDRNEAQRRLQQLAERDPLTGLFNRRRFEQEVERHVALARRYGAAGAVLLIDIDNFKFVNDTLGHSAGDELIALIADALRRRLRESDVLARLGGDEFAVLLPQVDADGARAVAASVVEDLRGHARGGGGGPLRPVTASVGVVLVDGTASGADELLTNADLAMYEAKEAGRDRFAVFASDGDEEPRLRARIRWLDRIQHALDNDGFVLHGQPIVDLRSEEVVAHELLLRMVDDDGELIPPIAFLPVAERFGLIKEIDRWVIAQALQLAAANGTAFSVNLSAKSLAEADLIDYIAAQLEESGADPRLLTFEITETAAVTNVGLARTFADGLHALGCRLSLDDFGAGFGSFYYLKHLPFDVVKIDGEFVSGCTRNTTDQLVIDAVVRMAAGLGKETVAEFTGDHETALFLRDAGVGCAQGYYLGRPMPIATASDTRPEASTAAGADRSPGT
jgi:diguanylate cyclase (GGDEF)-like protein